MIIEWTESAEDDLGDIYDYIAKDSPYYAEQFIERIIETTLKLQDFPLIDRQVPEAEERSDIRELIFQGYRIVYLTETNQINILSVMHSLKKRSPRSSWHCRWRYGLSRR